MAGSPFHFDPSCHRVGMNIGTVHVFQTRPDPMPRSYPANVLSSVPTVNRTGPSRIPQEPEKRREQQKDPGLSMMTDSEIRRTDHGPQIMLRFYVMSLMIITDRRSSADQDVICTLFPAVHLPFFPQSPMDRRKDSCLSISLI